MRKLSVSDDRIRAPLVSAVWRSAMTAKVPENIWPEFKVRTQAAYQAPSRAIARELAAGVVTDYGRKYDTAVACFMDDSEACIAHLRLPVTHRRAIRTTNLLERLFI